MKRLPPYEQFMAHRRFSPALAFSPDGAHVLFADNASGQFNLSRVPVDGGRPEQLTTFDDRAVRTIAVSPRDGTILFSADRDGDEFYDLYAIAAGGGWPERLTDAPQVQHLLGASAWSPDGSQYAYAANARTPADMEVWIREVDGDEAKPVFGAGLFSGAADFSPDGSRLLVVDLRSNTDSRISLVDLRDGETRELTPFEGETLFLPGPWLPDGSGFWLASDADREFVGLARYDLAAGAYEWVETPERDVDELAGSRDGRFVAWLENDDGWHRLRIRDVERDDPLPEPRLPEGCVSPLGSGLCLSDDGSRLALVWEPASRPAEVYLVETATGEARPLTESRMASLAQVPIQAPEVVRIPSFDGREIPAWLYRPDTNEPAPVVLWIHGGPEAQERPKYRGPIHYLRSRGIGVLATNVRGSTGYGKSFQKLIHRDWGGGDLRDFEAAAEWLRAQEWVDPERLGVLGGSYGGFATLSCVARLPEYWAAAVDIFGPSNLVTFARSVPPTWRRFMDAWVGNPDTEEEFLLERSPLTYIEEMRAPLLVIQGANDPRVVKAESDQLVERLEELGRAVSYEVFEDEGHGFNRYANEVRAYRLSVEWLERHLVQERAAVV
ncbi:MAG TPA: S9 family peptidase [Gaiellaceae bacterium]|jgi:dipeptidyl aminopeptidase/acylaminoacyl peptidase